MTLNPDTDLIINVADLTTEFRTFPTVLYQYTKQKAEANAKRDVAKAKLKEVRAEIYKFLKSDTSVKRTENHIESELDSDPRVMEAHLKLIKAEHDAATIEGAVESLRAKKDMLIQLGSDRRKEY
jgi:hypothetical protein